MICRRTSQSGSCTGPVEEQIVADENVIQSLEERPTESPRGYPTWVPALLLVLLLAVGGFAWSMHGQVATLGAELVTITAERDAALAQSEQRQALVAQGEAERTALEARRQELAGQLELADQEVRRLQTAAATAAAPALAAPTVSPPTVAAGAAPAPPAPVESSDRAAMPEPQPAIATPAPRLPPPQTLTIAFDVNSSYFPDSLNGRLRSLASSLRPDQAYAIELIGSIGNDPVANGAPEDAAAYNRWIAERRVDRIADFLRANAKVTNLAIERAYARNDPSRQVTVKVRPLQP